MSDAKPPVTADLTWTENLVFHATSGSVSLVTDGGSTAGPSPVQLMTIALAGCMAMDVVDIVRKGRHPLTSARCQVSGERAPEPPRRLTKVTLHFALGGDIPDAVVERAIALSRDKYCSVWNSMRQDIGLVTTFHIEP
jgi:putative redox protein